MTTSTKEPVLYILAGLLVVYIFSVPVCFVYTEHWDYLKSIYFVNISITTVGLGDIIPLSRCGILAVILLIPLGIVNECSIGVILGEALLKKLISCANFDFDET